MGDISSLGDLVVQVGGDISPFNAALEPMPAMAQAAADAVNAALGTTGAGLDGLTAGATGAASALGGLGEAAAGATPALAQYSAAAQEIIDRTNASAGAYTAASATFAELAGAYDRGTVSEQALITAQNEMNAAFAQANPQIKDFGQSSQEAAGHTETFKGALTELLTEVGGGILTFEGMKKAAEEMVEAWGNIERGTIALKAISGDAAGAAQAMENLPELAIRFGTSVGAVADAQQRLVASGVSLKDVPESLEAIAAAAEASNKSYDAVASKFDTIVSTGNLMGRSLKDLRISMDDVGAAMDMSGAPAADIRKAFQEIGDQSERADILTSAILTKFPTLVEESASSVENAWNRVKVASHEAFVEGGKDTDGFKALADVAIFAVKAIETGFLAVVAVAKPVADTIALIVQVVNVSLSEFSAVVVDLLSGNFKQALADIKAGGADLVSAWQQYTSDLTSDAEKSGAAIKGVWGFKPPGEAGPASSPNPMSGVDLSTLKSGDQRSHQDDEAAAAAKQLLADVNRELLKVKQELAAFDQSVYVPLITDERTATDTLNATRAKEVEQIEALRVAQSNLEAARASGDQGAMLSALKAEEIAEQNVKDAKNATKNAEQDLTATKQVSKGITDALAGADKDYAAALKATSEPAMKDYGAAIADVDAKRQAVLTAMKAEAEASATLGALQQPEIKDKSAIAAAELDLAEKRGDLKAKTDAFVVAQRDLNEVNKLTAAATAELAKDEDILLASQKNVHDSSLDLTTAIDDVRIAKQNQLDADETLRQREDDLAYTLASVASSTDDIKTATANAKSARDAFRTSTDQVNIAEQAVQNNFGVSKQKLEELLDVTKSLSPAAQTSAIALASLGITPVVELQKLATEAAKAYQAIAASGTASPVQVREAHIKELALMEQAYVQAGQQIPAALSKMLDAETAAQIEYNRNVDLNLNKWASSWQNAITEINGAITKDLSGAITGLITGAGSVADAFKKMGDDIVGIIVNHIIGEAIKPLLRELDGVLTKLGSILLPGGGGGAISGLGALIPSGGDNVFKDVPGGIGSLPTDISQLGQEGASAGSSAASGISGAIGSIGSLVTGAVSAVSGVVGIFQNMHQETSLNAIEHNTRYSMMYLGEQGDGGIYHYTHELYNSFSDYNKLWGGGGWVREAWLEALDDLGRISDAVTGTNDWATGKNSTPTPDVKPADTATAPVTAEPTAVQTASATAAVEAVHRQADHTGGDAVTRDSHAPITETSTVGRGSHTDTATTRTGATYYAPDTAAAVAATTPTAPVADPVVVQLTALNSTASQILSIITPKTVTVASAPVSTVSTWDADQAARDYPWMSQPTSSATAASPAPATALSVPMFTAAIASAISPSLAAMSTMADNDFNSLRSAVASAGTNMVTAFTHGVQSMIDAMSANTGRMIQVLVTGNTIADASGADAVAEQVTHRLRTVLR